MVIILEEMSVGVVYMVSVHREIVNIPTLDQVGVLKSRGKAGKKSDIKPNRVPW